MREVTAFLVILAAVLLLLYAAARGNEVFFIRVREGRVELVRGISPPGFLDDVRAIAKGQAAGTVRAVRRSGRPVLVLTGLDEPTAQRLRNTFATYAKALTRGRAGSRL